MSAWADDGAWAGGATGPRLSRPVRAARRLADLALALALLPVCLPLMAWIAWRIRREDGPPALYGARRVGLLGRPFTQWKFRTMAAGPEAGVTGGDKAGRVTALGARLRASRLDELPQLFNVLTGEMSFVGPRPPAPEYVARFPELYAEVLRMKPGVTGLATVMMHLHEEWLLRPTRTPQETDAVYARRSVPRKARLDRMHAAAWSPCLDLYILYLTAAKMLGGPGRRAARLRARAARLAGRVPAAPPVAPRAGRG